LFTKPIICLVQQLYEINQSINTPIDYSLIHLYRLMQLLINQGYTVKSSHVASLYSVQCPIQILLKPIMFWEMYSCTLYTLYSIQLYTGFIGAVMYYDVMSCCSVQMTSSHDVFNLIQFSEKRCCCLTPAQWSVLAELWVESTLSAIPVSVNIQSIMSSKY